MRKQYIAMYRWHETKCRFALQWVDWATSRPAKRAHIEATYRYRTKAGWAMQVADPHPPEVLYLYYIEDKDNEG